MSVEHTAARPVAVGDEARQYSDARFRAVFDHAPIGQIYSTMDGIVTSVNEPLAAMLGYRPDEMVGHSVRGFAAPEELPFIRETMATLLAGQTKSVSAVRRFRHRDGHAVPVRVTSALLRDGAGEPKWWVSMATDLTEEEHNRAELERAHETTLLAAARLRLLHSIATAANEASTLDDLAPRVLAAAGTHFRWRGGALLRWTGDAVAPHVVRTHGVTPLDLGRLTRPVGDAVTVCSRSDRHVVVVPVAAGCTESVAFAFAADNADLDEDQSELLSLIGIEAARVVERDAAARQLRESENRFRSLFDSSPLPMGLTLGDSGTFSLVNAALCKMLGRRADELVGHSAREICHPDDIRLTDPAGAAAAAAPDRRHTFELRLLHSSGDVVHTMITLAWITAPDGTNQLLAQMEDITSRRMVEDMLRRQAEEDTLTGLANRAHLGRVLTDLGTRAGRCAVLFIDLDGFKLINDTRGHDVGDEVLLQVAGRLRGAVRPNDLVARFGGDEFVVLCAGDGDEGRTARLVADRIAQSLAEPMLTRSGPAFVTASIGIAGGTVCKDDPHALLQRADTAMYQAKRLGKDRHEFYDLRLHERALAHQRTESALRTALDDGRFILHYQPIVELCSERIVGFEALVRLVDEAGAIVPPDRFIQVAEQSGLIVSMGSWVLRESCGTIARLRELTGRKLTVSVNVAARQAARPDLAESVLAALAETGLPDDALCLELTESALLEADDSSLEQLTVLRDRGVLVGLDDFGTGYSSLSYLQRFPVSHLKVDRSFVSGMVTTPGDHAIVRAVTRLADDLGLAWVAEGVETPDQQDALLRPGPGFAQGHLFSPPVPEDVLLDVLSRQLVAPGQR
jgi:diguanylate cyclase (GGDEF)-like protein/PAS domain S-box-containing protein